MRSLIARASLVGALVSCAATPQEVPVELPEPPGTILFVGNSFTFWNRGLWRHMEELTEARGEDLGAKTSRVIRGGAPLRVLWERTKAKEARLDIAVCHKDESALDRQPRKVSNVFEAPHPGVPSWDL